MQTYFDHAFGCSRRRAISCVLALVLVPGLAIAATKPDFGPNVIVFDPSMQGDAVQKQINDIWDKQKNAQFGLERYALLFKPGTYNVDVPVGFYTEVSGLGRMPDQVSITGNLHANPATGKGALVTFWRSAENLSVTPSDGLVTWAVSQATPMRRLHIRGDLALSLPGGTASGGFFSDTLIDGKVIPGAAQNQWLSRNSEWKSWDGARLNMVFVGDVNEPAGEFPNPPYTKVAKAPVVRERPYLEVDSAGNYGVRVPPVRKDSAGISWHDQSNLGKLIPISKFYIARPEKDTASSINAQLAKGMNLILAPGIYKLDGTIKVEKANTVVLGLGFATLASTNGAAVLSTGDKDGIVIAGLLLDAGPVKSPVILQVGPQGSKARHATNPISIDDVFFRVGGFGESHTVGNLEVNSNDTIVDHTWIWRADHGVGGRSSGSVGWTVNTSDNGLVVNGIDVTIYGLFVEHHQQYQTIWNGNGGRLYFYQCEIPDDPADQASFSSGPGVNGWAAYKVADSVTSHEAWGLGIYSVFEHPNVNESEAIEAPKNPNVRFHSMTTASFLPRGEISSVINGVGEKSVGPFKVIPRLAEYPEK
jgi:hypothetical protein